MKPKATVVIRRYVAVQICVLIVVVIAVLRTWTVVLVMYLARRAFLQIKLSVLGIVLENVVTITMTALLKRNAAGMKSVLTHCAVTHSVNQTPSVIWGIIVARRKAYGFGKIAVLKRALGKIVARMMTVVLLMSAVLLENVLKMVAR